MSRRWILPLAFAVAATAQQAPPKKEGEQARPGRRNRRLRKRTSRLVPKEYSFNPLQAPRNCRVGNYYFKKGNYRAAAQRFQEATKWDGTLAEAYLRLGESKEKQHDKKAAAEAYAKYLEVAPDAKDAADVKKRLERLRK